MTVSTKLCVYFASLVLLSCSQETVGARAENPFVLGVQSHFGQNWPPALLRSVDQMKINYLRDSLAWSDTRTTESNITFPEQKLAIFRRFCAGGGKLVMTTDPRHPAYDDGHTVASDEGKRAFTAYLVALARALPDCILAFEIGNEINTKGSLDFPEHIEPMRAYVDLLQAVREEAERSFPEIAILGGSSNVVATGFLTELAEHGMFDHVDGIAIHPYRGHAENLDWELRHLREVLAAHGPVPAIWATEFGDEVERPEEAAAALLKLTCVLATNDIDHAFWYALAQQRWFKNMGLVERDGTPLPAAAALALLQERLLPMGRPVRADIDPDLFLYQFGSDRFVVWGARRPVTIKPGSIIIDAEGNDAGIPSHIDEAPLIIIGARPTFGESALSADSLYGFASSQWQYHAMRANGEAVELNPLDSSFATVLGNRYLRPAFISDHVGAAARLANDETISIRLSMLPEKTETIDANLCLAAKPSRPIALTIRVGSRRVMTKLVDGLEEVRLSNLDLEAGSPLHFDFGPGAETRGGYRFDYRVRIVRDGHSPKQCDPDVAGWGVPS